MGLEALIGVLGFLGTLLLVLVGLLNFSVFRKQLRIARDHIDTALGDLERRRPVSFSAADPAEEAVGQRDGPDGAVHFLCACGGLAQLLCRASAP